MDIGLFLRRRVVCLARKLLLGALLITGVISLRAQSTLTLDLGQPATLSDYVYVDEYFGYNLQWYLGSSPISEANAFEYVIAAAGPSDAGTYTLIGTDNYGNPGPTYTITVTVNGPAAPANLNVQTSYSNALVAGQSATFSVSATGSYPRTYQWYYNNSPTPGTTAGSSPISGATASFYTINTTTVANTGNYYVVVTNTDGSSTSTPVYLTVDPIIAPILATEPAATLSLAYGNEGTLSFYYTSNGNTTIQWWFIPTGSSTATALSGQTSNYLYLFSATTANDGTYYAVATDAAGSTPTTNEVVTVTAPIALTIATQPTASTTLTAGGSTELYVYISGSASSPVTYQWYKGSTPISGATYDYYYLNSVQLSDAGTYSVVVTNPAGTVTSTAAVVTVNPQPPPVASWYQEDINPSSTTEVNAGLSGNYSTSATYQWYHNGQLLTGATSSSYSLPGTAAGAGEYFATITTEGGATTTVPNYGQSLNSPNAYTWLDAQAQGDYVYFLFAYQMVRYQISTGTWLAATNFPSGYNATAMLATPEGLYIGFGHSVSLYSLDLSTSLLIGNTTYSITTFAVGPSYVYMGTSDSYEDSIWAQISRTSHTILATTTTGEYDTVFRTHSIVSNGKIYGVQAGDEPSNVSYVSLTSAGAVVDTSGTFSYAYDIPATVFSIDANTIVDSAGNVINTLTGSYFASLGTRFTDLCILSDGKPVVIRNNVLTLYDPTAYGDLAKTAIGTAAMKLVANGTTVLAFTPPTTTGGPIAVTSIPESQIDLPTHPLAATVSPTGIAFVPDYQFTDNAGNLYLLSRLYRNLFVWSPTSKTFTASLPLQGAPDFVAYSGALNKVAFGYADKRITIMDLTTPSTATEVWFATSLTALNGITFAGSNLVAGVDDGQDSGQSTVFYTGSGVPILSGGYEDLVNGVWDAQVQALFSYNGGSVGKNTVNTATGVVSYGSYNSEVSISLYTNQVWLSPDGSLVLTASGGIAKAADESSAGTLGITPNAAAWTSNGLYTAVSTVTGTTVQKWAPSGNSYAPIGSASFSGYPIAMAVGPGGVILLTTETASGISVTNVDPTALSGTTTAFSGTAPGVVASPAIVQSPVSVSLTTIGGQAGFNVLASGSPEPTYQWYHNGLSISGATAANYVIGATSDTSIGSYTVMVTNTGGSVTSTRASLQIAGVVASQTDFLQTGNADIVLQNSAGTVNLTELNGTSVTASTTLASPGAGWTYSGAADFNGDGMPDLVFRNMGTGEVRIEEMNGTSVSSTVSVAYVGYPWVIVGTADFNGDGHPDIVWENPQTGEVGVWLMNGTTVSSYVSIGFVGFPWQVVAIGDMNGDGNPDIVWENPATGEVGVWFMNGTTVSSYVSYGSFSVGWKVVGAGDYNKDGNTDLLWQSTTGFVGATLMNGTSIVGWVTISSPGGTTNGPTAIPSTNGESRLPSDFGHNGNSDVVWQNPSTGEVGVWIMNGTTVAGYSMVNMLSPGWTVVGTGDFNGDGNVDMLVRNQSTGEIGVWLLSGLTYVSYQQIGFVGAPWVVGAVGDFNGDGKPDIVWRNPTTGEVGVWLMNGTTVSSYQQITFVGSPWVIKGAGDFNGDGKTDILWFNPSTGEVGVWLMSGLTVSSYQTITTLANTLNVYGVGDFNGDGYLDILLQDSSSNQVSVEELNGIAVEATVPLNAVGQPWVPLN